MGVTLEEVAAELLAAPLDDFVQRRRERAAALKADDAELAAQVAKLPKPVASAHLLDAFARERPEELDGLLDLGAELRDAQERRDGDAVRALTSRAHEAVRAALASVHGLADDRGSRLTDEAAVEQTLRAAMADDAAAAALRAGLLVKPLAPAGFGEVDLSGAVAAVPAERTRPRKRATTGKTKKADDAADERRERAVRAAQEAVEALERAEQRRAEAQQRWEAAAAQHEEARRKVDEAEELLGQARAEERERAGKERATRKDLDAAERPLKNLTEKAEQARRALDA
jgi:hypothetical protein